MGASEVFKNQSFKTHHSKILKDDWAKYIPNLALNMSFFCQAYTVHTAHIFRHAVGIK